MDAIEAERCTSIYGTPTMFVDILAAARQKKPDVSHVETGIMAGRGQGQGLRRTRQTVITPCYPQVPRVRRSCVRM